MSTDQTNSSQTIQIIKAQRISNIIVTDINLGKLSKKKIVPLTYNDNLLVFQTPFLEAISAFEKTEYPNIYLVELKFKGDTKDKINEFFKFLEKVEDRIEDLVKDPSRNLFTKNNATFKSVIREQPNTSSYYMKFLIKYESVDDIVDLNGHSLKITDLKIGDKVRLILELSNLWIDKEQFGLSAVIKKSMIKPHVEKTKTEYVFDQDSEVNMDDFELENNDDDDTMISLIATDKKPKSKKDSTKKVVRDLSTPSSVRTKTETSRAPSIQSHSSKSIKPVTLEMSDGDF